MERKERYFWEIGVYRVTPEVYEREYDNDKQKFMAQRMLRDVEPQLKLRTYDERESPGPWRFNQIVGYLRLFVDSGNDVIKADYWRIAQKRYSVRMGKKLFRISGGNAIEVWFSRSENSREIYRTLSGELETLRNDKQFEKLHIDLATFHELGQFVNWRAFLNGERES